MNIQDFFDLTDKYTTYTEGVIGKTRNIPNLSNENFKNLFENIGGNKYTSFLLSVIDDEQRNVVRTYYDLLQKTKGNVLVAGMEFDKIGLNANYLAEFQSDIHKMFALEQGYDDINQLMKSNKSFHEALIKEYMQTSQIPINKDIVKNSAPIDVQQPIQTSQSFNDIYQNLIDETFDKSIDDTMRKKIKPEQMEIIKKNTDIFFNYTKAPSIESDFNIVSIAQELDSNNTVHMFRQGDMLIINGHGGRNGKLGFGFEEISVSDFIQKMKDNNLIPEDIKSIYTLTCHGGALTPFVTSDDIRVMSSHTSLDTIYSNSVGNGISFQLDNKGEVTKEFIEDFLRNKDKQIEQVASTFDIEKIAAREQQELDTLLKEINEDTYEYQHEANIKKTTKNTNVKASKEAITNNAQKYKPKKGPKLKQKTLKQTTKSLPKKTLSGGGKLAIGLAIAGAVVGGIIVASSDSPKSKNKKKETKQTPINNQRLEDSYAMQIAKDISSYRYGKHMTGFVNP